MEGVRCPGAPTAAVPLLLWWAALEGDSRVLWLWHHGGRGEDAVGLGVMQPDGEWEMWVRLPPSLCLTQRGRWQLGSSVLVAWVCGDGTRRMTANAV